MMLSIYSCASLPSVYIPWRNVSQCTNGEVVKRTRSRESGEPFHASVREGAKEDDCGWNSANLRELATSNEISTNFWRGLEGQMPKLMLIGTFKASDLNDTPACGMSVQCTQLAHCLAP